MIISEVPINKYILLCELNILGLPKYKNLELKTSKFGHEAHKLKLSYWLLSSFQDRA